MYSIIRIIRKLINTVQRPPDYVAFNSQTVAIFSASRAGKTLVQFSVKVFPLKFYLAITGDILFIDSVPLHSIASINISLEKQMYLLHILLIHLLHFLYLNIFYFLIIYVHMLNLI